MRFRPGNKGDIITFLLISLGCTANVAVTTATVQLQRWLSCLPTCNPYISGAGMYFPACMQPSMYAVHGVQTWPRRAGGCGASWVAMGPQVDAAKTATVWPLSQRWRLVNALHILHILHILHSVEKERSQPRPLFAHVIQRVRFFIVFYLFNFKLISFIIVLVCYNEKFCTSLLVFPFRKKHKIPEAS